MENNRELRHSCKFCKKRFSCGRALGGHMRSHMTMNSGETEEKLQNKKLFNGGNSNNSYVCFEESANSGYGLRENPKKTWRLSGSGDSSVFRQEVCKDCGKGFQSLKALFGHMRCHSERFSRSLEDDSWSEEQMVLDSQSDNEGTPKKRRSRRTTTRYGIGTSSVSVSDEQEQLAICLMMLSRDVGFWGNGNSRGLVAESSDNNSVSVEIMKNKPLNGVSDHGFEFNKLESDVSENGLLGYEVKKLKNGTSDYGLCRDELKKSKSDVSAADESGFEVSVTELGENSIKKTRMDCSNAELGRSSRRKTRVVSSDTELERDSIKKTRFDCSETELRNYSSKKTEFDGFGFDSLRKKIRFHVSDSDLGRDSYGRTKFDPSDKSLGKEHCKRSRFECTTCNKIFHSYQALGGHRASHKKVKGCFARIETGENSIEADQGASMGNDDKTKSCKIEALIERGGSNSEANCGFKKIKIHECPICLRVFPSGQALGGHKRSHMAPARDSEIKDGESQSATVVIQQKSPEISDLLDLNLPAPIDEEVHSHIGFESWWVGNSQTHERLCDDPETQFAAAKLVGENNLVSSKHTDFHSLTTPPRPCLQV